MITVDHVLHVSAIVFVILLSASLISYTSKFIFRGEKIKKPSDLIYDPDYGANITAVCIFSENLYSRSYEKSPCHNKTLIHWYNPWLRHGFWTGLWNSINARNRLREIRLSQERPANKTEPLEVAEPTEKVPEKTEKPEIQKTKTTRLEFFYAILVGLLVISMIFACWEAFKDRLKKNAVADAKSQGQECTLADFTINRHRRRESQQQQQTAAHLPRQGSLESTSKVTQTLIHQSSLDRDFPKTISEAVKSMEERRSSVPTCLDGEVHLSGRTQSIATKMMKRQSIDVTGEEICPDLRKKSRHLIRRH